MSKIEAKIIKHSICPRGNELITYELIFPRFILAELGTHRMFSKNSASSRAIPFNKMVESVQNNPFIPIAWQKEHKGMQGTEYLDDSIEYSIMEFAEILISSLKNNNSSLLALVSQIFEKYENDKKLLKDWWLLARDKAIESALLLHVVGVTKQLCNRLLEPFMWHKVLLTTGLEGLRNFFELRCPEYYYDLEDKYFKSKKEWLDYYKLHCIGDKNSDFDLSKLNWLNINKGQSEIHMMDLAEAMWDAMNESTPKELKAREWHIPYENYMDWDKVRQQIPLKNQPINLDVKIAAAMCARVSYTVVGEEDKKPNYSDDIRLHDILAKSGHWSPFEHCARVMTNEEYESYHRGRLVYLESKENYEIDEPLHKDKGWCKNFKGFIQYRELIEKPL